MAAEQLRNQLRGTTTTTVSLANINALGSGVAFTAADMTGSAKAFVNDPSGVTGTALSGALTTAGRIRVDRTFAASDTKLSWSMRFWIDELPQNAGSDMQIFQTVVSWGGGAATSSISPQLNIKKAGTVDAGKLQLVIPNSATTVTYNNSTTAVITAGTWWRVNVTVDFTTGVVALELRNAANAVVPVTFSALPTMPTTGALIAVYSGKVESTSLLSRAYLQDIAFNTATSTSLGNPFTAGVTALVVDSVTVTPDHGPVPDSQGAGGTSCTVVINSSGGNGNPKAHTIRWGDGLSIGPQVSNVFTHVYTNTGTFTGSWDLSQADVITTPGAGFPANWTFSTPGTGAPTGWTKQGPNVGSVNTNSNGQMEITSASTAYGGAPALISTAMTATADFGLTADLELTTVTEQYPTLNLRADASRSDGYALNGVAVEHQPSPTANHYLVRQIVGGTIAEIGAGDFTYQVGTLHQRLEVQGNAVRLKLWYGATEPGAWTFTGTTTYTSAGKVLIGGNNGSDGVADVWRWDNVSVYALSGTSTTVVPIPASPPTGYSRVFAEDFDVAYPVGSFAVGAAGSANDGRILSTSAAFTRYGSKLNLYPDDGVYPNVPSGARYYTSRVISTRTDIASANGVLNMNCHTETIGGVVKAVSGWLRPITSADSNQLLSYSHVAARMRVVTSNPSNWGAVMLFIANLWPQGGEMDFPEGNFADRIGGFFHYADPAATVPTAGNYQLPVTPTPAAYWTDWHVFEQFWQPGHIIWKMDGVTYLDTTDRVPTVGQKLVWQSGVPQGSVMPDPNATADWQIDWITVDTWTG